MIRRLLADWREWRGDRRAERQRQHRSFADLAEDGPFRTSFVSLRKHADRLRLRPGWRWAR